MRFDPPRDESSFIHMCENFNDITIILIKFEFSRLLSKDLLLISITGLRQSIAQTSPRRGKILYYIPINIK